VNREGAEVTSAGRAFQTRAPIASTAYILSNLSASFLDMLTLYCKGQKVGGQVAVRVVSIMAHLSRKNFSQRWAKVTLGSSKSNSSWEYFTIFNVPRCFLEVL